MRKLGGYEIIEKIGAGGMCTIYRGRQISLDRPVAIKVLSERLSDNPEVLDLFSSESLIIAKLNHPNIIHVIDRGITADDMPYFVMEFVEGTTLSDEIRSGSLTTNRKIDLMVQVCRALSYAHKNGVIHRDIKPANILIDTDGNVQVLDFGIAKFMGDNVGGEARAKSDLVMGTLAYMAPEQQSGFDEVTAASDLYSLGVVMYELFAGIKPIDPVRRPSEFDSSLPEPLEEIILRCLEAKPEDRFGSADEMKDHLLEILQGAHLQTAQRERAKKDLAAVGEKFNLLDVIKEDLYGGVYLFQDRRDQRLLVIKRLSNTGVGLNEARLLTTLKHKNIVDILGASGDERRFIVVMEYLTGGSLQERLIKPMPWAGALRTAREIAEGLAFAHKNRITHGNLRPRNILFTEAGRAKIVDFGLEEAGADEEGAGKWSEVWGDSRTPQSDIFALGTVVYQMLTAQLPIWEDTWFVPDEYFEFLPKELQLVAKRLLSWKKGIRYETCAQVIAEFDALLAAFSENPDLPGATEVIALPTRPVTALQGGGRGERRLVSTLVLLLLLVATTVVYLVNTGHDQFWVALFRRWFEQLASM